MAPENPEIHGILTYISELSRELAQMAERTGHQDLVTHLLTAGEVAATKVRVTQPDSRPV